LSELDELVRHVNDTARAVDEREGAIVRQLDTVNQLSRMVAHEVRNPLQTLELLTSLVAEESDPAERATLAQSIHAEIRALDTVVQRVLRDGVGTAILKVQPVLRSIAPLIEQVTLLHRAQAQDRGVSLVRTQVDESLVPFDPALMGRSIENLVVNALHAVPQPGGRIELSAWVEDGFLQIATDDNGPGIDPALGDAVFQPDVSTRVGGTGLGLALVRSVVHAHGGYVHQQRSPLGGARLLIQLPLEGPPVASVSPEHPRR
jgi:signal transduction histidine kinase